MRTILDKCFLLAISLILCFDTFRDFELIIPFLIAITACCIDEMLQNKAVSAALFVVYCIAACFYNPMLYFAPIAAYGIIEKNKYAISMSAIIIPLFVCFGILTPANFIKLLVIAVVTAMAKIKTNIINTLTQKNKTQRDSLTELTLELENKLNNTVTDQNFEIKSVQLGERNRIAREIHDNVGHQLSCSIIQLGAIIATEKDEMTKMLLTQLNTTLNESMTSIRNSVHNLRDESLDLYTSLYSLCSGFTFCKCSLKYEISENPDNKYIYAFTGIVKEALSNVIKHSNATEVNVMLYEHPMLYQLIISDNGTKISNHGSKGMGMENIRQRVSSIDGIVNITTDNGYRIFVSAKKQ